MQGNAKDERGVKYGSLNEPAVQRGLDVLIVELG
jgi:hypothetical protein